MLTAKQSQVAVVRVPGVGQVDRVGLSGELGSPLERADWPSGAVDRIGDQPLANVSAAEVVDIDRPSR